MSSASENNGRASSPEAGEGVLANLPRTRPQRSSPRRAAARRSAASAAGGSAPPSPPSTSAAKPASAPAKVKKAKPKAKATPKAKGAAKAASETKAKTRSPRATKRPTRTARPTAPATSTRRKPVTRAVHVDESVPRQGFESEMDRATGPVQPPGGAELVSSAAEIFGELARSGISTGERLLKDALARLPL